MRQVQSLLRNYASSGRTVLLSTHLLEMAERQCDRIAIVHRGRLVAEGRPAELLEQRRTAGTTLEEVFLALTAQRDAGAPQ